MQVLQPNCDIDESPPDGFLFELAVGFLVVHNLLVEIAVVRELHDDAELVQLYHKELASMKACL